MTEKTIASPSAIETAASTPLSSNTTPSAEEQRWHAWYKYASLALMVPHTILYTLLVSIARKPDADGHVFFGPSAVVLIECLKMSVSLMGVTRDSAQRVADGDEAAADTDGYTAIPSTAATDDDDEKTLVAHHQSRWRAVWNTVKGEIVTTKSFRLIPPALIYVCQNNLQVYAAGVLTPAEYQVVGQTKLAFAALFSVLILKRKLNFKHWRSIVGLVLGTAVVQIISSNAIRQDSLPVGAATTTATMKTRTHGAFLLGTLAMLSASACSGLAGVLIEKLIKKKMAFWTTNLHLAFFSLLPAAIPVFTDALYSRSFAPLRYFTPLVFVLVGFNVLGGIVTSLTMKYADNILKNFAESTALIVLVFVSSAVSGIPITLVQIMGTALIVLAIAGYARA